jgi:hypothetical protein
MSSHPYSSIQRLEGITVNVVRPGCSAAGLFASWLVSAWSPAALTVTPTTLCGISSSTCINIFLLPSLAVRRGESCRDVERRGEMWRKPAAHAASIVRAQGRCQPGTPPAPLHFLRTLPVLYLAPQ